MPGADVLRLTIGSTLSAATVEGLLAGLAGPIAASLVVIEGGAESFCDGLDVLSAAGGGLTSEGLGVFAALLDRIACLDRPVAAVVRASALGGGAGLAACADFVIATPEATFGLPEAHLGLIPAVVFPHVARRIGVARARLMALGAAPLPAEEAWRIGLIDVITTEPDQALAAYAKRAARLDTRAVAEIKSLVCAHFTPPAYLDDAVARFGKLAASAQTQERLRRFAAGDAPWGDGTEVA